ncbi:MAG: CatB-related O-acetyltransferase [Roseburia sp.]|nr:CatB-related O-acetyltransferase [Roseburia sp.]
MGNHPGQYISTNHFLWCGGENDYLHEWKYDDYKEHGWYFSGVKPRGIIPKYKRIKIGNDVWLGKNVIITNGADIGNGVIAGAGAVITKDVPDYAIVGGVPARIIRYRYEKEQIEALNKIAWWDWSDDEIRERYDDFYLSIEQFIEKYYE